MAAPGFWENQERAQRTVGQLKSLKTLLKPLGEAIQTGGDLTDLIDMAAEHGCSEVALSYHPTNPARKLYSDLGFAETGEMEDDEVVARRRG